MNDLAQTHDIMHLTNKDIPKTAFMLSSFGAMLILIEGLFAIFFRSIIWAIAVDIWVGIWVVWIGIILVMIAAIIGGSTTALVLRPGFHKAEGATIMTFGILGLIFGGGYIIGSILCIVGGLMAIMWKKPAA
ncbi:MAG: hypothetical protein GXX95_10685 [Methanomassiliicoccus sp.]|jgi:hypothetical protein|nr:hypothetical protein [Methanomassiliicoccus sp.]